MANDAECGYVVIGAVTSMEDIKARKEQTKTEAEHGRVEWTEPPLRNFTNQALLTWFGYDSKFNLALLFFCISGGWQCQNTTRVSLYN